MKALTFAAAITVLAITAQAQPPASPKATAEGSHVKVAYGQPSKKGRVIFGGLVPYGQVWRTGANEATEITFDKDGMFGGKPVKAGTYTLWTMPGEKVWTVILNSHTGIWGTQYEKIKDQNVLQVIVPSQAINDMAAKPAEAIEKFTIRVTAKDLVLEWDKTRVAIPISF